MHVYVEISPSPHLTLTLLTLTLALTLTIIRGRHHVANFVAIGNVEGKLHCDICRVTRKTEVHCLFLNSACEEYRVRPWVQVEAT